MTELLNPVTTTETMTEYTRSYGGAFSNPYKGVPSLIFHMQRLKIRDDDGEVVRQSSLTDVGEPYVPNKVYALYNPDTGEIIPGQTFITEQYYAQTYSIMRRALLDIQILELTQALNVATASLTSLQSADPVDDAAVAAALVVQTAAQIALDTAKALLPQ